MTILPKARRFHVSAEEHFSLEAKERAVPPTGADQSVRASLRRSYEPEPESAADTDDIQDESENDLRERLMLTTPADDGFGDLRLEEPEEDDRSEEATDDGSEKTDDRSEATEDSSETADNGSEKSGDSFETTEGRPETAEDRSEPAEESSETTEDRPEEKEEVSDQDSSREAQLAAIRKENLSPRQIRVARRVAKLHNIQVTSDEEAVLELRKRDIDPSHRAALGKVLAEEGQKAQAGPAGPGTPAIRRQAGVPAVHPPPDSSRGPKTPGGVLSEEARALEVQRIQRELVSRRRRRMAMLAMRLLLFVILPTVVTGWYYFLIATPLYETQSQFQIQVADSAAAASGSGGLLSASPLAVNKDAVSLQSYLTSRMAMIQLDEDHGFKEVFQDPAIDPITRLAPDATNEDAYKVFQESVKVSYDPTEGVVNMRVTAPTPEKSKEFSLALLGYAEDQVDQMTVRLREDQMKGAMENYEDAETKLLAAQRQVQSLQEQLGVLDPQAESSVVMQQVSQMEGELITKQLELGQLLTNPDPVQSRVDILRGDIERLRGLISETRMKLTEGNSARISLAEISGDLRIAEGDLLTWQTLLASAAEQKELARIEANKQVRYLSLSVPPVAPDEASYPKAFQNTVVAFIIFAGIYLLLSLTVSILREQVST